MTAWDDEMRDAGEAARRNGAATWRPHVNMPEPAGIWRDGVTAAELNAMAFPPITWVVPDFIAEGCTLLAGRPKLGKSWLVLDAALAVAAGGETLGRQCEAGDVLYLALEDNRRRLQSRLRRLWPFREAMPSRLLLMTEWPTGKEGVGAIAQWIKEVPSARLVIVDVLAMFKGATPARGRETLYELDYAAVKGLQSLASRTGVAIVIVHHTRKSGAEDDPFEKVSGTLGLSGAADTTIVLDRNGQGCTLYGRGRDVTEFDVAVEFDKPSCRWRALGEASEVRRSDERAVILALLADNREGMSPAEIADALGLPRNNIKQLIFKMTKAGEIEKAGKKGRYVHPDHAGGSDISHTPDNPDNRGNHGEDDEEEGGYRLSELSPFSADSRTLGTGVSDKAIDRAVAQSKAAFDGLNDPNNPEAWR